MNSDIEISTVYSFCRMRRRGSERCRTRMGNRRKRTSNSEVVMSKAIRNGGQESLENYSILLLILE
jgi:hypothetical protein